jgi:hypothetical protein
MRSRWYWIVAGLLIAFGAVAILSIGAPFLLLGLTMLALSSFRSRPTVFWPVLGAVVAFLAGFVLTVPTECVSWFRDGPDSSSSGGYCTSLLGVRTQGEGTVIPALAIGLVLGISTFVVVRIVVRRAAGRPDERVIPI